MKTPNLLLNLFECLGFKYSHFDLWKHDKVVATNMHINENGYIADQYGREMWTLTLGFLTGEFEYIVTNNNSAGKNKKLKDVTVPEFIEWRNVNCKHMNCVNCMFKNISCAEPISYNGSVFRGKDYSQQFLNQEMEVLVHES